MKKTFNINIAGTVFIIDDDAYTLLNDYLDTLQHAFGHSEEGIELTTDIESRIAEIFSELNESGQSVITLADVEGVISRIGRPEEMLEIDDTISSDNISGNTEEEIKVSSQTLPPPYVPPLKLNKKLFRDPQGSMVGGVCMGLANYTGIDVTWIRLLTVALSFASVSVVSIVYIIMCIVVPEAKTPLQRMQMMGKPATVDNIGRTVTDNFKEAEGISTPAGGVESNFKRIADILVKIFAILARVLLICALVIAIPVVIALAFALIACLVSLLAFSTSIGMHWWNNEIGAEVPFLEQPALPLLCGIGWILFIGIPLFALCWSLVTKWWDHTMTRGWKATLIVAWILSFILTGVTTGMVIASDNGWNVVHRHNSIRHDAQESTLDWQDVDESAAAIDTTSLAMPDSATVPVAAADTAATTK